MRAARGDAEVLYEDELAKYKKAEEETPMEAPKEGGAEEDDPIGEGGADGTASFNDIAGRLVHCDRGGRPHASAETNRASTEREILVTRGVS